MSPPRTEACSAFSPFVLDLYRATGSHEPAVAEHLATCASCRGYLAALGALDATRPRFSPPTRRWPLVAGLLAMAAAAALYLSARPGDGAGDYVGVKGMPSVQLLVRHDAETAVWSGAPIHPGDALAFRIACEGMSSVSVAALDGPRWTRVKDAACPGQPSAVLPFTLLVDSQGESEHFAVVVSARALDDAALRDASESTRRTAGVWTFRFDVPKTGGSR